MTTEKVRRKWDLLTAEQRAASIKKIIGFFEEEREEKIGVVAAEKLLDLFLSASAENIYNKAIDDAKALAKKRSEDFELDLLILQGK